jgi:F420-non-reducing hydrogenase large subunit
MPDFILGPDSDPSKRNVAGLAKANPELTKKAIEARKIGQRITEDVGGKAIHPVSAVPGGMSFSITPEKKAELEAFAKRSVEIATESYRLIMPLFDKYMDMVNDIGLVQSDFLGMTGSGRFEQYDGSIKAIGPDGGALCEFSGKDYLNYIDEKAEPYSYMKFTYLKKGSGFYRVGPLARLNVVDSMGTPEADRMLAEFRAKFGRVPQQPFLYHIARLIEYTAASEKALAILQNGPVTEKKVRNETGPVKNTRGVGVVEAPRGTLIHDYAVNEKGFITRANLIVATGHNNQAMDKGVLQASKKLIKGGNVSEGALNRIEMVVRAYDPCVSCATHAISRWPIMLRVLNSDGKVIREVKKC